MKVKDVPISKKSSMGSMETLGEIHYHYQKYDKDIINYEYKKIYFLDFLFDFLNVFLLEDFLNDFFLIDFLLEYFGDFLIIFFLDFLLVFLFLFFFLIDFFLGDLYTSFDEHG